jgi:hypothetical protein
VSTAKCIFFKELKMAAYSADVSTSIEKAITTYEGPPYQGKYRSPITASDGDPDVTNLFASKVRRSVRVVRCA